MKHLSLLVLVLSLSFCKSIVPEKTIVKQTESKEEGYIIQEKMEIIPKQIIHFSKDEAGVDYLKLLPGDKTVFRYTYKKKPVDITLMDATYNENIVFEVPEKIKDLSLKDAELKTINLTAQYFAFRNAKLFKIEKGSLNIKVIDKHHLEIEINIDDSYKMIQKKHIKQVVKL